MSSGNTDCCTFVIVILQPMTNTWLYRCTDFEWSQQQGWGLDPLPSHADHHCDGGSLCPYYKPSIAAAQA